MNIINVNIFNASTYTINFNSTAITKFIINMETFYYQIKPELTNHLYCVLHFILLTAQYFHSTGVASANSEYYKYIYLDALRCTALTIFEQ
jgi:hypothetical protein